VKSDTCNIQIHFLSVSNRKIKKNVPVYKVCQAGYHDAVSGNSMILTMVEKAQHLPNNTKHITNIGNHPPESKSTDGMQ
jgi:hypothetical protein